MEKIHLRDAWNQYRKPIEIEQALVWNAVKKFLDANGKSELFAYISDIQISEKNISIYIKTSIAKNEFAIFGENFHKKILQSLSENYDSHRRNIKIL